MRTEDVSSPTTEADGPARTRAGRLNEIFARWVSSGDGGGAFGRLLSTAISVPQLRRLTRGQTPWVPLGKPLAETTVVLISTGGEFM